jgi:acyl carrier protein
MMRLTELVAAVLELPPDEVTDATAPHNTGAWTSLAQIKLAVAFEEVYGVLLSVSDIEACTSVAAARKLLTGKGATVG